MYTHNCERGGHIARAGWFADNVSYGGQYSRDTNLFLTERFCYIFQLDCYSYCYLVIHTVIIILTSSPYLPSIYSYPVVTHFFFKVLP